MKSKESRRHRGGVSRSVDYVASSLALPSGGDSPAKPGALLEVRDLVVAIDERAMADDFDCASFLAELTVFFSKRADKLSNASATFAKKFAALQSGRATTKKSSPLRPLISQIIRDGERQRHQLEISRVMCIGRFFPDPEKLLQLPEFGPSPEAIEAWATKLVYPRLKAMEPQLAADPQFQRIKKAYGFGGTFRVSRLRRLIRETVERIAAVPKFYYFVLV